ncbi:MAG: peptidase domain-containing ABC transporter [Bacteroidales bacterium]|nr:peptidase domain-containing ABC transporter [Bacteroidales bacterium]
MSRFPFSRQLDTMDCGPACLQMITRFHGKSYSLSTLRDLSHITRDGVTMLGISDAAEEIGYKTLGVKISLEELLNEAPLPCILHWQQNHFVVLYKVKIRAKKRIFCIADPAIGNVSFNEEEFMQRWLAEVNPEDEQKGICLLLEPGEAFHTRSDEGTGLSRLRFIFSYLKPHRKLFAQLVLGMLLGSLFMLIFPFLTQSIIDVGIQNQDLTFISLVLLAMMALFLGQISVEFIRGWILLHISTRINISLISDFLIKIMKLPIGFFDSRRTGDLIQRILDHDRIQSFLTMSSLSILFSIVNFIIFGLVLLAYNSLIFIVFLSGSLLYALWVYLFMKRRKELDYARFSYMAENQGNLFQLVTGMQEIKLNNCETEKRWDWEKIQAKLFRVNLKSLSLSQYQNVGALFFIRTKDILIIFLSASLVLKGELTLGMMLAIQYILGQVNNPVEQMVNFIREAQDANISMARLDEVSSLKDEEGPEESMVTSIPAEHGIRINNLSFQYEGPHSPFVLQELSLDIPDKKITAIVGPSGSGKTTLIKLMMGFYPPVTGSVSVGDLPLQTISPRYWRSVCGAVMQEGFIFSDTISSNIAMSREHVNPEKLNRAIRIANLTEFIESLPTGLQTKIGPEGHGISEGQKQRILIARAVYKDPEFIFFDEATNSLDANNERMIIDNLNDFFSGKTVVVVAHRLSTVKNADQIVVLDQGCIVEQGTHKELTALKGAYYELVKNQLELGY